MARAVDVFRQNFRELGDKARRTATTVGETNAAAGQVSEGARSQTTKLSRIAVALRESTGALKSVADNTKAASDKATATWWGTLGLPTKRDQERTLHAIHQLNSRVLDLEERLAERG